MTFCPLIQVQFMEIITILSPQTRRSAPWECKSWLLALYTQSYDTNTAENATVCTKQTTTCIIIINNYIINTYSIATAVMTACITTEYDPCTKQTTCIIVINNYYINTYSIVTAVMTACVSTTTVRHQPCIMIFHGLLPPDWMVSCSPSLWQFLFQNQNLNNRRHLLAFLFISSLLINCAVHFHTLWSYCLLNNISYTSLNLRNSWEDLSQRLTKIA